MWHKGAFDSRIWQTGVLGVKWGAESVPGVCHPEKVSRHAQMSNILKLLLKLHNISIWVFSRVMSDMPITYKEINCQGDFLSIITVSTQLSYNTQLSRNYSNYLIHRTLYCNQLSINEPYYHTTFWDADKMLCVFGEVLLKYTSGSLYSIGLNCYSTG